MTDSTYKPFNEFFFRVPLYPINNLFDLPDHIEPLIQELLSNDQFLSAVYLGSRSLYNQISRFKRENKPLAGDKKFVRSILKYWLRMSTRPTPFGIFAGNAMGKVHDETQIILDRNTEHQIHARVDMYILGLVYEHLNKDPAIRNSVRFYPNTSIFISGDKLRYLEYKVKTTDRIYAISEVDYSEPLKRLLEGSNNGARISQLVELITDESVTGDEAYDFVLETIDSQLLVSELDINITGTPYLQLLIDKLTGVPEAAFYVGKLKRVAALLGRSRPTIKDFELVEECISSMIKLPDADLNIIHADLFITTTSNHLSKGLVQSFVTNLEKLLQLLPNSEPHRLTAFREKFQERYEHRTIPLMQALDPETGVGYNSFTGSSADTPGLLGNIHFTDAHADKPERLSDFSKYINGQLYECLNCGKTVIEVTEEDIQKFSFKGDKTMPDNLHMKGVLVNDAGLPSHQVRFVLTDFNSASTSVMIGRFCHGNEEFRNKVLHYNKVEESFHEDAIFAEVAHVNNTRHGNITARPLLRDFEIPYLANSMVKEEYRIDVKDLYLKVVNKKIILWNRKLNKRVIPKLTNAHNYKTGIPVYAFLCDLQFQNLYYENIFNWSEVNNSLAYLPSVVYKNIVISKARWKVRSVSAELNKYSNDELLAHFKELAAKLKLPRYVVISQGDNDLPVDMQNIHCLRILAEQLVKRDVVLHAFPHNTRDCLVKDVNGHSFSNEVVIPITRTIRSENKPFNNSDRQESIQRHFVAGSEWLYIKIFCSAKAAEYLLIDLIKPFIDSLIEGRLIDQWFFIKYNVPENHLRIRFHGKGMFWSQVIEELKPILHPKIALDKISKYEIDTYIREIERYGSGTMAASEQIFYFDSNAVLDFLCIESLYDNGSLRWIFALRGIDAMLDVFGLPLAARKNLMQMIRDNFFREFKGDKPLKVQLDLKYREEMKTIAQYMNRQNDSLTGFDAIAAIIDARSKRMSPMVGDVKKHVRNDLALNDLIGSYIHMFLNRLLVSDHRKQELVLYHMLTKYYESQLAKAAVHASSTISVNTGF